MICGYISDNIDWPWLFWVMSLFDALIVSVAMFIVDKTYAPVLLSRKAKVRVSFMPPLGLLATRPVSQVIGSLIMYIFGVYTLMLSTSASLWTDRYGKSIFTSGLHYIAISLGSTLRTQLDGPLTDKIYLRLKTKAHGAVSPEYRGPLILPATFLAPICILWYRWSTHAHSHWIMVDIGIWIFALGFVLPTQAMVAYLIGDFGEYRASAMAASKLLSLSTFWPKVICGVWVWQREHVTGGGTFGSRGAGDSEVGGLERQVEGCWEIKKNRITQPRLINLQCLLQALNQNQNQLHHRQ
ncbi:hypothetical protein B7494_g3672 [Chlorociboria aeruginascens]|nr:hypothetical protein B7494_g3672 [Chlorociboria aeruginascens]